MSCRPAAVLRTTLTSYNEPTPEPKSRVLIQKVTS
jgi:hypothetical protein